MESARSASPNKARVTCGSLTARVELLLSQATAIRKHTFNPKNRFHQIERLMVKALPVIRQLERFLDHGSLPLSPECVTIADHTDRLLRLLGKIYYELSQQLGQCWLKMVNYHAHALATLQATRMIHWRAMIAHRAYTNGSARRWGLLMTLLHIANQHGFSKRAVDPNSADTIETLIISTTLIALAEPTTLDNTELKRLQHYIDHHKNLVSLHIDRPSSKRECGIFLITDSSHGPRPLSSRHAIQLDEAVLDCRPMLALLKKHLDSLRADEPSIRLGLPLAANDPAYIEMLDQCLSLWSEPQMRRDQRSIVNPTADMVTGFEAVRDFVGATAYKRTRSDMEYFSDDEGPSYLISKWAIVNRSLSGFKLRYIDGYTGKISIGEIVALSPRESGRVYICSVIRALNVSETEFEIGLELLGKQSIPAFIKKTAGDEAIESVPVLLLPMATPLENKPGLIAALGGVRMGSALDVPHKGHTTRLEARMVHKRFSTCELIELKKVSLEHVPIDHGPEEEELYA